ncbi:MAG: hypothetical protein GC160_30170 [Acidobacteria bacterium]|nr:hypothetical protein [Acidobacteriota bacterium]
MRIGVVYSETTVHAAPEVFAGQAPYQIALADFPEGRRLVRIEGTAVHIGDRVRETAPGLCAKAD